MKTPDQTHNHTHNFTKQCGRTLKKLRFIARPTVSCLFCSVFLVLAVWTVSGGQQSSRSSEKASGPGQQPSGCQLPPNNAYDTTVQYLETFYPLWFTKFQAVDTNTLVGPERV